MHTEGQQYRIPLKTVRHVLRIFVLVSLLTISKYSMRQRHVSRIRDTETYINRAVIVTTRRRYTYLLCALRFRVDDLI